MHVMKYNRRSFLRLMGIGSGSLLLTSVAGKFASKVYAQGGSQGCFAVFVFSNGMPDTITTGGGSDWQWAFQNFPLAALQSQITPIEDTFNPFDRQIHGNYQATLCVRKGAKFSDGKSVSPGGITIDRAIAKTLAGELSARSINLGHPYGPPNPPGIGNGPSNLSGEAKGVRYPVIADPTAAIAEYIPTGDGEDRAAAIDRARRLAARRASILDFLADDIDRMSSRLASSERAELDQYLTSVRELEKEAAFIAENGPPFATCEEQTPVANPGGGRIISEAIMRFHVRFAAAALGCGVARVASIYGPAVGGDPGQPTYPFDPVNVGPSLHDGTTHRLSEPEARARVRRVFRWRADLIREFWTLLATYPAAMGGSLADESLAMWLNTQGRNPSGGNNHNRQDHIPVILLGSAGGRLKTGSKVSLGSRERCVSDVFLTAAQAMGSTDSSFGEQSVSKGPIPGLLI